jgi:hypothetical protein
MFRIFLFSLLLSLGCSAQVPQLPENPHAETVRALVREFIAAGDVRDADRLQRILHHQYRVAVNQFMDSPDVRVIDRPSYLTMIREGKLGGTTRKLDIESTEITGHVAYVRAVATSETLRFDTLFVLMRDVEGKWWLVSETPYITPLAR